MTGYYPPPQETLGNTSAEAGRHPTAGSSPFYVMPTQDTVVQPASYQPYDVQHSSDGRASFSQFHSPTPQPPITYNPLSSSPRSDSSYSQHESSLLPPGGPASLQLNLQIDSQWHLPHDTSSHSASNPTPVTNSPHYADSQSPIRFPVPVYFDNPDGVPTPAPSAEPPSSLGEVSSYQPTSPYLPGNGPSFPVPQLPPQPAIAKGKAPTKRGAPTDRNVSAEKKVRSPPYSRSERKTRKVSPSDEQPVASSSRNTLDTPPPLTVRLPPRF